MGGGMNQQLIDNLELSHDEDCQWLRSACTCGVIERTGVVLNKYISEIIGEEDHSPMYFAELYKGQAHDAHLKREGRNELIAEQRLRAGITVDGEKV